MKGKTMFKKFLYLCSFSCILILFPVISFAASPVVFFSDLVNGPKTGGQNNKGAFVTIWGNGFGATRETSVVTIGGGQADNYPIWTDKKITFQLGPNAVTGNIVVQTAAGSSNGLPFTINNGRVFFASGEVTPGSGSGTYSDPFTNPDLFLQQHQPGDILYLRAGTYTAVHQRRSWGGRNFVLGGQDSGTADAHVSFVGYPGELVTLSGQRQGFIMYDGVSIAGYIDIANMTISGSVGCYGAGNDSTVPKSGGHDIRLIGNVCIGAYTDNTMSGIAVLAGDNNYALGNDFSNQATVFYNNNHAVYIECGPTNVYVGYNTFHDMVMGWVIQVHTDNAQTYGMVFQNINIYNNTIHCTSPDNCRGINAGGQTAIGSYGAVYNNVLYNVGESFGGIASYSGSWKIYNNTFYSVKTGNTLGNIRIAGWNDPAPAYLDIRNNVMYVTDGASLYIAADPGSGLYTPALNDPRFTITNNLYYGYGNGPSQDTNAVNANPLFVNPSAGDFHLNSSSPAIDTGSSSVASVVTKDFDGNTRPMGAGYDIGAYEYNGPAVPMLQFSAAAYSVSEGAGTATISVTRIGSSVGAVAVSYVTSNGTATSGSDYTAASGTLNWADTDVVTKTFTVSITNDTVVESDETINLTLSNPTGNGAILGSQSTAVLTILDDDGPSTLRFENSSYSVSEGAGTATIRVLRTGSSAGAVSVNYATSNGTAIAASDYTAASNTLTWADADTAAKSFTITIINDTTVESSETVNLTLSNPTNGAVLGGTNPVVLTITDNDSTGGGSGSGSSGISTASATDGGATGGGCGFVKDDDNGKGPRANGGAATFAIMLILSLAGIAIARRFSNRFSYNL